MKVVFISQGYPPLDGGVATSTYRIAHGLARSGCTVTVFTFQYTSTLVEDDRIVRDAEADVTVIRFGPYVRSHGEDENEMAVARRRAFDNMLKEAEGLKPDLVMSFYAAASGLLGLYLANALGVPHVAGIRGNDVGRNMFSTTWLPVLKHIVEGSEAVVCVNGHLSARLRIAFSGHSRKISVIQNSVEIPAMHEGPRRKYLTNQTAWGNDDVVAVFIGTPREKKGIATLLDAVRKTAGPSGTAVRLLIIGPTLKQTDRRKCGQAWDSLVDAGVLHVTGQLPREQALAIAREADIIVMPSLDDGLANGLLEGMALGLCPVASDIFEDVVEHGKGGWITRRGDVESLTDALVAAAQSGGERRRRGGYSCALTLNRFSVVREISAYRQLFDQILGNAAPANGYPAYTTEVQR